MSMVTCVPGSAAADDDGTAISLPTDAGNSYIFHTLTLTISMIDWRLSYSTEPISTLHTVKH